MQQIASRLESTYVEYRRGTETTGAYRAAVLPRYVENGALFLLLSVFWGLILFLALTTALQ